ncbi:MAG: carbamoyl phosphate synthase small subunit [Clostridiales bacterium]|nr:carbamoyl phosphate synthase small subunit [Clostridiales bacterium]
MKTKKVYLTLQNSDVFQGYRFGAEGDITGELVFSTNMVGYMETLTDPSNYGKIVVQTFPLIGNYGVIRSDVESEKCWVSAYIVREICDDPSNFRMQGKLDEYLKEQGVIGIYGIDTRQLTKVLREEGVMSARISSKPLDFEAFEEIPDFCIRDAVKTVAPTQKTEYGEATAKYTVALWNFGAKNSMINNLVSQDCKVVSMPATATAEEILALGADGVMLSDGPGDPEENKEIIEEIKKVVGKIPVFGVGLGHQMVALAFGAETMKQKQSHVGGQPVKCQKCGKVYISSQNHGYTVIPETIKVGKIKFINVNDGTCEGIDYDEYKAFTIQFTPESCSAGNTENPLYKKFFQLMKKENENA